MAIATLAKPAIATAMRTDDALHRSLLATLAYFDQFDYPLTLLELRRLRLAAEGLPTNVALSDVLAAVSRGGITTQDGLYFLEGRSATVARRKRGYRLAEPKYRKAMRAIRWMRLLPTVRMVAVCNSLALSAAEKESDIDLFMVVRPGFLWITRLLTVGLLALTGQRPDGDDHADTICLSFFVSERALDLRRFALPGGDTYLAYWTASLVPLYDPDDLMTSLHGQNAWLHEALPGTKEKRLITLRRVSAPRFRAAFLLPVLRTLESVAKRLQMAKFPPTIAAMMNRDTRVVVTDDILKFHVNDRRAEFERAYRSRLTSIGL